MRPSLRSFRALVPALIVALPVVAAAQSATPVPTRPAMFAVNPLGIPLDVFQAELEHVVGTGLTLAALASHVDDTDVDERTTSFDLKLRYYPSEDVFNRISAGLSAGWARYSRVPVFGGPRESLAVPTIGVHVDYNWLQGKSRRFVIGIGMGAKRIIASAQDRNRLGLDRAEMTGRFVVGITF